MSLRCYLVLFAVAVAPAPAIIAAAPVLEMTIAQQAQQLLDQSVTTDGPGAVMLIAKGDTVLFRSARGRADIELGVPLSTEHVFRIASVTKMFTAAMLLKLGESGRLSLDDTLAKYLPDFPNAGSISLRQLLSHTAGISDVSKDPQPGFARRDLDTATLLAEISKRPPNFAPGTGWAYSNAGFILLGAVIEKITGTRWYAAVQGHLLEPLGLRQIRYGDNAQLIAGRVVGYSTDPHTQRISNAAFISASLPGAAGGLVATVDDLRRWTRALAGGRVISKESYRQMIAPTPDLPSTPMAYRYGLGMYLWHVRGNEMFGHTGQINGFAAMLAYLPKQDITIIVLANADSFDARTMGRRLAAIALGQPYRDVVGMPFSEAELQALPGAYRFDAGTIETLFASEHKLYAQRGHGNITPLQMTSDQQLHFVPDELSYFVPVRGVDGAIVRLDYFEDGDGPARSLPRISQ